MFSLFRRSKSQLPEVPEWASFFEPAEYAAFMAEVERYFDEKSASCAINYDDGVIVSNIDSSEEAMGLVNLAQVCKSEHPKRYKKIVPNHFDTLIEARLFDRQFKEQLENFELAKPLIAVRIYPEHYAAHVDADTSAFEFAPGLLGLLVLDQPQSIINVRQEHLRSWGKTEKELFALGIGNVRDNYTFEIQQYAFDDLKLWFVQSDHFFASNILFDFDRHPEFLGSKGALVGIPHRHAVLLYPIENSQAITAAYRMITPIAGMYHEGPGSISDRLFWYRDGTYTVLPYVVTEDELRLEPPPEFMELFADEN